MYLIERLKNTSRTNKEVIWNIIGAFIVKGGSLILGLFTMPAYMNYFSDANILGVWFTILSVISWIMTFDLGIGNGLRNKLPIALANNDKLMAKQYISSAYLSVVVLGTIIALIFYIVEPFIQWNSILNIDEKLISEDVLSLSIKIVIIGILLRFILGIINSILYAVQKAAVNNFISFIGSVLIFLYVKLAPNLGEEKNLIALSIIHVLATNLPLLAATIAVFASRLRYAKPNIKYFSIKMAKDILNIGIILLWLQIVWMVVSSMHSILITRLLNPGQVVEYQIYFKIFNTIASVLSLMLLPVWSAVTKAQAECNYRWINKINNILITFSLLTFVLDLIVISVLQYIFNFWLGENSIDVNYKYAFIMAVYNSVFIAHSANGSISNGLSRFKIQSIFMGLAAVLMIPISIIMIRITDSWIGVILATIISVLPYEIIQPISTHKYLKVKLRRKQ